MDYFQRTVDTSHNLTGTYQGAYIDSNYTVQAVESSISGTLDGTSITVTLLGYGQSCSGTLNGDTLTLTIPDSAGCLFNQNYHRATIQEYNTAVNALRQRAARGQGPYVPTLPCPSQP